MKTIDGVEFKLGMTLVTQGGREIPTNEQEHVIMQHEGVDCIGLKAHHIDYGIDTFYSSQEARIKDQVAFLEDMKRKLDIDIEHIKKGGSIYDTTIYTKVVL